MLCVIFHVRGSSLKHQDNQTSISAVIFEPLTTILCFLCKAKQYIAWRPLESSPQILFPPSFKQSMSLKFGFFYTAPSAIPCSSNLRCPDKGWAFDVPG